MIDDIAFRVLKKIKDSEGARFTDLLGVVGNPRTLSRKFKFLISKELVEFKNHFYRLTEKGEVSEELLEKITDILEDTGLHLMNIDRIPHRVYGPLIERYCKILYEQLGSRLVSIAVFGSVARGDWRVDSDIDLLVIAKGWDKVPAWKRIRELLEPKKRLRETREYKEAVKAGFHPTIQHYPLAEGEALKFHMVYLDICIEGIILYEKEGFLSKVIENLRQRLQAHGARRIIIPGKEQYWVLADLKAGEAIDFDEH